MGEALGVVCWGIQEGMGFMLGCTGWNGITMGAGWRLLEGMMVTLGLGCGIPGEWE